MGKLRAVLAGMLAIGALLATPVAAAAVAPMKMDWSSAVDFSKTGLNRYDPADAALLKMLSPERIYDPADRARFKRQLDSLIAAQSRARADGATRQQITRIAAPQAVDTIDPGCQLTSSSPGGYDLCGYDSAGDWMSAWGSGRRHRMWAAVQESDTSGSGNDWRVWWKSQAYGLTSDNVDHRVNVKGVNGYTFRAGSQFSEGGADPPLTGVCSPCYWTGSAWRPHSGNDYHGSYLVRDYVEITGTNDTSGTDNVIGSMWWDRSGNRSFYPGPNNYQP
jgi:hypothetical protein